MPPRTRRTRRVTTIAGLVFGAVIGTLPPSAGAAAADADSPQIYRYDGGGYDRAAAIAVDGAGNAYIGGSVDAAANDITFAVVKLSPTGAVLWTAFYDGSSGGVDGSALAVTTDTAGNVYAAGSISDGAYYPNVDYLVVKFGPDGGQRWARRYDGPGSGFDRATRVAVDAAGAVYVSGTSYTPAPSFRFDWATRKYSATGDLLWERRQAGSGTQADKVAGMVLTPDGDLVVTGITGNPDQNWATEIATVRYDPGGTLLWRRLWSDDATGSGLPRDIAVDPAGRITVTGTTGDVLGSSAVTLRYDGAGTLLGTVRGYGGSSVDVDGAGNFYLAGYLPQQPGGSFVARFAASGTRTWATPLSLDGDEALSPVFLSVDSAGAVTAAGTVRNVLTYDDAYLVIRYAPDGRELWRYRFNGPAGRNDLVAGLGVDGADDVLVTGTSWNGYPTRSERGTADDIVTLRFAAGAVPPLLAPTDLAATGISASQIRLTWTDNAGTEDGFRIERCLGGGGCGDFSPVATVGRDVTTYTDQGLAGNTRYSYRVLAFNAHGVSAYTDIATGKTRQR